MSVSKQETFDKVVSAVIKQGRPAMNGSTCKYRSEDGLKCAAGHLIPDEKYTAAMDDYGALHPDGNRAVWAAIVDEGYDPEFVRLLQRCHDTASKSPNFVQCFADRARGVAFALNLSTWGLDKALTTNPEKGYYTP